VTDVWVCTKCKSINREREDRCYSCGSHKDEVAAPDVTTLEPDGTIASRRQRGYASSTPFAIVAGLLLSFVAATGLYLALEDLGSFAREREAFLTAIAGMDATHARFFLVDLGHERALGLFHHAITVAAMLAFWVWLSRDGRTERPSDIDDAPRLVRAGMDRLGADAVGFTLLVVAFLALVGGFLVDNYGTVAISQTALGVVVGKPAPDAYASAYGAALDRTMTLKVITQVVTAVGAMLLVVVIARGELRTAAHNRAIREAARPRMIVDAPPPAPPSDDAGPLLPPPPPG
jgi:hypothetical protein